MVTIQCKITWLFFFSEGESRFTKAFVLFRENVEEKSSSPNLASILVVFSSIFSSDNRPFSYRKLLVTRPVN